jgi:hypothetical protein
MARPSWPSFSQLAGHRTDDEAVQQLCVIPPRTVTGSAAHASVPPSLRVAAPAEHRPAKSFFSAADEGQLYEMLSIQGD